MRLLLSGLALLFLCCSFALSEEPQHPFAHSVSMSRGPAQWVTEHIVGQTIPFNGGILKLGEYYATILVGGQRANVQVDTGSSTLAVPDVSCSSCIAASNPPYNPALSSFFHPTSCPSDCPDGSSPCSSIVGYTSQCQYSVSYGDGSGTVGVIAKDKITLSSNLSTVAYFGRMLQEIHGFGRYEVPGILGVGYSNINFSPNTQPTIIDQLSTDTGLPRKFGMCMTVNGGAWDVGYTDASRAATSFQTIPCSGALGYYQVTLTKISFSGTSIATPTYNLAIVDSGTTLLIMPPDAIYQLQQSIATVGAQLGLAGYQDLSGRRGCSSNISPAQLSQYPSLKFTFTGQNSQPVTVELAAKYYILAIGNQYCLAVSSLDYNTYILGDVFMQAFYTVFDKDNSVVQLAPLNGTNCPGYGDLPIPVPSSPSGSNTTVIVAVVVSIVAVLVIGGLIYWRRSRLRKDRTFSRGLLNETFGPESSGTYRQMA